MNCLRRFLCWLLALQMSAGPAPTTMAQAPEGAVAALPYVPTTSCGLLVVRPAQILTCEALELLPIEVLQAAVAEQAGLDLLEMELLSVAFEPPLVGPPNFAVVARFRQAAALPTGRSTAGMQLGALRGQAYLQSADRSAPSFWLADPRTLLAAPDSLIQRFAAEPPQAPPGSLAARASSEQQDDDLYLFVDLAVLRPLINLGIAQIELPADLISINELVDLVDGVRVRVNISHAGPTQATLIAASDRDAVRLLEIFDEIKATQLAKLREQARKMAMESSPVQQALGRYQARMAKLWDAKVQFSRTGRDVQLIELDLAQDDSRHVISVATIGVLVALLLPAIQAAREAARRASSTNNLKQLMLALHNYEATRSHFPAHANYDNQGRPLLSWRVHILPMLEQQALYDRFHLDESWDSEHNRALIAQMPQVFMDPSSTHTTDEGLTNYLAVCGEGLAFDHSDRGRRMREFKDGTSNTVMLVQSDDQQAAVWTKPEDWEPDEDNPLKGLVGSLHPGVFITAFVDGSVRSISNGVDKNTWLRLIKIDDGEAVRLP